MKTFFIIAFLIILTDKSFAIALFGADTSQRNSNGFSLRIYPGSTYTLQPIITAVNVSQGADPAATTTGGNWERLRNGPACGADPDDDVTAIAASISSHEAVSIRDSSITYTIKIMDSRGVVVKTLTSPHPFRQEDITGLLPGTYIIKVTSNSTGREK